VSGVTFLIFAAIEVWQGDRATIPTRLLRNRDVWGAVWYGVCIAAAGSIFTYYLPIWFQAIQHKTATQSGLATLPSLIGLVLFAIIGGALASALGYYTPLLLASSVLTAVGAGMLSTLTVGASTGHWIGYQILFSAGMGLGAQNVMLVASVAVAPVDMPLATTILTFTQTLASAVFLPVGQSVFQNELRGNQRGVLGAGEVEAVLQAGAVGFRGVVPESRLAGVLAAYNGAVVRAFYVAVAMAGVSIFGPVLMRWLALKG
ncbi:hypothetical protein BO99DRAFT_309958, partial [Aspergillus violaceofuscus CBS 115571]